MDYKSRLANLSLLPLSLWLESLDILLFLKLLKHPPENFDLGHYVTFGSSSVLTRSGPTKLKLATPQIPRTNSTRHFYFNRVIRLWNKLPPLNLDLPLTSLKAKVNHLFWDYFIKSYSIHNPCTWYICYPCSTCICTQTSHPTPLA